MTVIGERRKSNDNPQKKTAVTRIYPRVPGFLVFLIERKQEM